MANAESTDDPPHYPAPLRFDGFTLDMAVRVLVDADGHEISLRRAEFELLVAFVRAPGRALSRDHLLQAVAGRRSEPHDRTIDVLVGRLRRRIEKEPRQPRLILTVPGAGYRLALRPHPSAAAAEHEAEREKTPLALPERRQLTILQCRLTGPAFASARPDPEDLHTLLGAFHARAAEVVERAGGTIADRTGDGVLAYFGYPRADEYQVERAIRAGLRLIEATNAVHANLHARVGIATSLVVVGGLLGDRSEESAALGEAASLAAELVAYAKPDSVWISAGTLRLAGGLFDCSEQAPIWLAGAAESVPAWRVIGESGVESRFEALRGRDVSTLVGRDEEVALLLQHWQQARAGAGKVVLLLGEPGIGKSRLARALQDRVASEADLVSRYFCSPHHQDSAFYPLVTQLERAAGFGRDDAPERKLGKLEALLARAKASDETIALIAGLLSLPTGERYRLPEASPQKRREMMVSALLALLFGPSTIQTALIIYEDAHWIDPSSLELLARTVEQVPTAPVLLLLTARPEFKPAWPDRRTVTTLTLNRLEPGEAMALVECVLDGRSLPDAAAQQIVARAQGVPLFIEELTKAVLESRLPGRQRGGGSDAIPASLHDSLMARLDRLGPAREIAQIGAAIGREFTYELLGAVAGRPAAILKSALSRLLRSELLFQSGAFPNSRYSFKHVLVQQAAYESLLRNRRTALHARIAEALLERNSTMEEVGPELLAWHCEQGGLIAKAVGFYTQAGWRSTLRSAYAEAREQFTSALRLIATLPDGALRDQRELEVLARISGATRLHQSVGGFEPTAVHARAAELWKRLGRPAEFIGVAHDPWIYHLVRGETHRAQELADLLLRSSREQDDPRFAIAGHLLVGCTAMMRGELSCAHAHLQESLATIRSGPDDPSALWQTQKDSLHPWAAWANANCWLGNLKCWLGFPDQAMVHLSLFLERALAMGYGAALANVATYQVRTGSFVSEAGELAADVGRLSKITGAFGLAFFESQETIFRGYVAAFGADPEQGLALMHDGIAAYAATQAVTWSGYYRALLAEVYQRLGRLDSARELLADAQDLAERTGERWYDAELERRLGDVDRQQDHLEAAEQHFARAIAIARRQNAKLWELHAATSLARLRRDQHRIVEARSVLAPVHGRFTEGFETASLRRAKALLDELDQIGA